MQGLKGHPGRNWWLIKSYMGLMATTNAPPPAGPLDFAGYRVKKDFRTLVWVDLQFDDAPGAGPVHASFVGSQSQSCIVDPGYTPPVDFNKVGALTLLKDALIVREAENAKANQDLDAAYEIRDLARRYLNLPPQPRGKPVELPYGPLGNKDTLANLQDRTSHAGEKSPLSAVHLDRMHPQSMFPTLPPGERLIADGLIRFRAGEHTDDVGMKDAGAHFHVPWVWAEFLLTSLGGGRVRLRGAGSIFPTMAWYLDDRQVAAPHRQVGDSSWPQPFGAADPRVLKIWPVLSSGAPKAMGEPPAKGDAAAGHGKAPVTSLPWTCPGGPWVDVQLTLKPSAA